jgi:hypothetical protein
MIKAILNKIDPRTGLALIRLVFNLKALIFYRILPSSDNKKCYSRR